MEFSKTFHSITKCCICRRKELPNFDQKQTKIRCIASHTLRAIEEPLPSNSLPLSAGAVAAAAAPAAASRLSASAGGGATVAAPVIAVLVFACNRVTVARHLDQLLRFRPDPDRFPVIVSQDCGDRATADVIKGYGTLVKHIEVRCARGR